MKTFVQMSLEEYNELVDHKYSEIQKINTISKNVEFLEALKSAILNIANKNNDFSDLVIEEVNQKISELKNSERRVRLIKNCDGNITWK